MTPAASGLAGALFLGILQGLTEFLPVSSSGHLVLFQQFVDVGDDEILFDLVLHLGTLVPVLWFYRDAVLRLVLDPVAGTGPLRERKGVRDLELIVAASVPTAAIGLLFEDLFEVMFATPAMLTLTFGLTGALLLLSGRLDRGEEQGRALTLKLALLLGVVQGMAITPGISRSGSTIAVALMLGVPRGEAARFSFLMSVPAISGAVLLKLKDVSGASLDLGQLAVGGLASMVTGYVALALLVRLVLAGRFHRFGWYCFFAAGVAGVLAFT